MKKTLYFFLALFLLISCSGESTRNKNPFIPNYSFSIPINTNLPLYSGLNSAINPIIINDSGSGVSLIVMKVSSADYRAWDCYCPNQYPSNCSKMTINGVNAKCACENNEYSLFTGVGNGQYTMKPYSVEITGSNSIRIYN